MAVTETRPATYADIEDLPAHMVGQILYGVLYAHPLPAPRHALATTRLGAELMPPLARGQGGPGVWVLFDKPELHLGEHVVVPDIAGWRRERMPALPETAYFETAPDWVCEVLSPSTAKIDRTDKLRVYAQFSVGHCWYVDPDARTLEVFALDAGSWRLAQTFKDSDTITAPPFAEHSFALDTLWTL